eukprot:CAMPEP_0201285886 /NCGR_PEP_ID=MMETSP1317-20130820/113968_1 /ASSEMBLY_ACC=CAM_ASM_000770 /TAXON_ID=187299 /ORGANISM="Undescribed Undescribed, Strain Undescribed" /LENGTH=86 /DNA_ID=CAMNT_0047612029 /DNA_START=2380 /DNA_END=2640 /DNA_ORIENTATION=-
MSHSCGRSGFEEKKNYKTVNIEVVQKQLYEISSQVVVDIKSKYVQLAQMLIPVSMALLTEYNEETLGIATKKDTEEKGNGSKGLIL